MFGQIGPYTMTRKNSLGFPDTGLSTAKENMLKE